MSCSVQPRPQGAFPWLWPGKSVLVYEVVVASYLATIFYYIADSMKVALDIGNCALSCDHSGKLLQFVPYVHKCLIPNYH